MRLSGRDLRVLPGVVMVLMYIPLPLAKNRRPTAEEECTLEDLLDRFTSARELVYDQLEKETGPSRQELIQHRLQTSLDWGLSSEEMRLVGEALDLCIHEAESDRDVNVYFNGDEYGVTVQDMYSLRDRLGGTATRCATRQG